MAGRPPLGRDDSYNRVSVPGDLKSQVLGMINDSSESLPLSTLAESEDDVSEANGAQVAANRASAQTTMDDASAPPESVVASDAATPKIEKPNPLEQVPTVREPSPSSSPLTARADGIDPVLATPSPVRSHEILGTGSLKAKLPMILDRAAFDGETDVSEAKDTMDKTASRATTVSQSPSGKKEGKNRPGLAKRMSTAIKRTVSKPSIKPEN